MKAKRITEILQAHPTTKHQNTWTTENHAMSISHILRKQGRYYGKKLSRLSNSTAHSKLPSEISWLPALSGIPKKGTIPEEWI